jgi:hypothetical protein
MSLTGAMADEQSYALLLGSTLSNTGQGTSFHLAPLTSRLGTIAALMLCLLIPQVQADLSRIRALFPAETDIHIPRESVQLTQGRCLLGQAAYFFLGDCLNTLVTVIATLQNEAAAFDTKTLNL